MTPDLQSHSTVKAFQIRGGVYTLTTLELHVATIPLIREQLKKMTLKAPNFFQQTPVIVAIERLQPGQYHLDTGALRHLLHAFGMILVAIRGGTDALRNDAAINGIAWLHPSKDILDNKNNSTPSSPSANVVRIKKRNENSSYQEPDTYEDSQKTDHKHKTTTMIRERPVRSGQQIYSPGDIVVLGSVSAGAELVAGGHIHIYGALRGRALAGVNGNKDARIFCRKFEAELVSVYGQYKLPTHSDKSYWGNSVLVSLKDQHLHMTEL